MTETKEKLVPMTVRFSPSEHKEIRKRLADEDVKFQTLAHSFIEQWLRGQKKVELRPVSRYAKDIALFESVLDHGTPAEKETLRAILKSTAESIQGRRDPDSPPIRKAR